MATITVVPDASVWGPLGELEATVTEFGDSWMVVCNQGGDLPHECPTDLEPGDTWSSLEPAVQAAVNHIALHERLAS